MESFILRDNNTLDHKSFLTWLNGFIMTSGGEKIVRDNTEFAARGQILEDGTVIYTVTINTIHPEGYATNDFTINHVIQSLHPKTEIVYSGELNMVHSRVHGVSVSNVGGIPGEVKFDEVISSGHSISPDDLSEFLVYEQVLGKLERVLIRAGFKREPVVRKESEQEKRITGLIFATRPI